LFLEAKVEMGRVVIQCLQKLFINDFKRQCAASANGNWLGPSLLAQDRDGALSYQGCHQDDAIQPETVN
jgi:hypothetical protein